jgi:hypothetical protein
MDTMTRNGEIVRGMKSTYTRHGTVNLFGAIEVATGVIRTEITERKRRIEFLNSWMTIVGDYPDTQEIFMIIVFIKNIINKYIYNTIFNLYIYFY